MIYRRAVAKLRAQDWFAIGVELGIVIVGVFIGTWVADWNEQRIQKRQVAGLVDRLRPTLNLVDAQLRGEDLYYATTHRYGMTALAGWNRDPKVSDGQFVVAAYQASQVTGTGSSNQIFSTLIGADQVREVDDPLLRNEINRVLGADFYAFTYQSMLTDYRQHVREWMPDAVQQRIRAECGDKALPSGSLFLPPTCAIRLPGTEARAAAAILRSRPELVRELDYHLAQSATFRDNIGRYDVTVRTLMAMIDEKHS